ncbi:MAG: type II secretion system F family protein [Gammaproteobacteria bacterium]|nr:type II secretion system F family protein [Gammaproteobacteria bacterium]
MASFEYKGRNRRGEAMSGNIDAETAERVAEQLFRSGITPTEITEILGKEKAGHDAGSIISELFKPGVDLDELVMFCRQMRTLLRAGIPILKGLSGLADSVENPTLAAVLRDVHDQLESGRELNRAFASHPEIFMPLFVALVRVGESTGQLDQAFAILSEYLEAEKQTRQRIKSALRYPAIVISAMVIAMVIINVWVVPVFVGVFEKYGAELPIMTKILMTTSSFTVNWWPAILVGLVSLAIVIRFWLDTQEGRYRWDKWLLRAPIVGGILTKATLGRFAKSLAMVMKAGVPMVQGLTVVSGVVDNAYVSERVLSMRDGIEKGDTVARTAAATGLFTPLVLQMLAVGEETGAVDELLNETALHYQAEVNYELENLSSAIEPIVITILGVMVTVLALGVFLPMWNLSGMAG